MEDAAPVMASPLTRMKKVAAYSAPTAVESMPLSI